MYLYVCFIIAPVINRNSRQVILLQSFDVLIFVFPLALVLFASR